MMARASAVSPRAVGWGSPVVEAVLAIQGPQEVLQRRREAPPVSAEAKKVPNVWKKTAQAQTTLL